MASNSHMERSSIEKSGRPLYKKRVKALGKFQFTPVVRRATRGLRACRTFRSFNSRPSCDGRRCPPCCRFVCRRFNSRPSCDGRPPIPPPRCQDRRFNSRPSCDGRLANIAITLTGVVFQFTPVVRRATAGGTCRRSPSRRRG